MARMGLSEILKATSEQPEEFRGEYLRRNWNPTLGLLIRLAYDGVYEWALPEGAPPYTANQYLDQESNLYKESRRLYLFLKGSGDHVPQGKKELLFGQLLEGVSKEDAELLLMVKDGQLPYGITKEFVIAELPGQLLSPREDTIAEPTFPEPTTSEPVLVVESEAEKPKRVYKRKPATKRKKTVASKTKKADK